MNIRTFDLNLLPVFRAIFETKSVSYAAKSVGLSQPAVSNALSRLRAQYGDPLFERVGGRMEPTDCARDIAPAIIAALDGVGTTLQGQFDPAGLSRTFKVGLVSYSGFYVLPALIEKLRFEAPNVQVLPEHMDEDVAYRGLEEASLDFALGIFWNKRTSFVRTRLMDSSFNVIMRPDHPLKGDTIRADQLIAYPHVRLPILDNIDKILDSHGLKRNFGATSPNPLAVPFMVARSDMLAILPSRLAMAFTSVCPLREASLAFALPRCEIELVLHQRHRATASYQWFAGCIEMLTAEISAMMQPTLTAD